MSTINVKKVLPDGRDISISHEYPSGTTYLEDLPGVMKKINLVIDTWEKQEKPEELGVTKNERIIHRVQMAFKNARDRVYDNDPPWSMEEEINRISKIETEVLQELIYFGSEPKPEKELVEYDRNCPKCKEKDCVTVVPDPRHPKVQKPKLYCSRCGRMWPCK